jgi:hypothetical protein
MQGVVVWYDPERTQGIIQVIEEGIVQRFYLLRSKVSRGPVEIKAGQVATFPFAMPPRRPGLLPVAMCVEIEPNISSGLEALSKPLQDGGAVSEAVNV